MGQYRATDVIHRGLAPSVQPGEIVPDTIVNMNGEDEPQDFDRLVELGVVEPANAKSKRQADGTADGAPDGAADGAGAPVDAPAEKAAAKPRRRSKAAAKKSS